MNHLYVISKKDSNQVVDKAGSIDDGYYKRRRDGPAPRWVGNPLESTRVEHRHHQRFQLYGNAFALIRPISAGQLNISGKSMGGIACAVYNVKPARLGRIDNICMGGLMFQYVDSKIQFNRVLVLDILLADCGFYLANISFNIIADAVVPEDGPGDPIEMRQARLEFNELSSDQLAELQGLILKHGTEMGALGITE